MVGAFNAFICSLTHILSALFSSTSVLFFCPPFGSYKATEVSSREVIIMKSLKDLTEISLSISPTKSSVFTTPGQLAITALAHICLKVWLTGYTNKAVPTYTVPHPIFNFVEGNRKQPLFKKLDSHIYIRRRKNILKVLIKPKPSYIVIPSVMVEWYGRRSKQSWQLQWRPAWKSDMLTRQGVL